MFMKITSILFFTVLFCLNSYFVHSQDFICKYSGYTCSEIMFKDLRIQNKTYYKKFSEVPFTGKVVGSYKGLMIDGKKNGSWVLFY